MIKANAYGHGDLEVFHETFELGVRSFGVASLEEALRLRQSFRAERYLDSEIYVFSDFNLKKDYEIFVHNKILPVISHLEDLEFVLSKKELRHMPVCLIFNTGMNRLGLSMESTKKVASYIKNSGKEVYHLMTHFSDSYLPKKKKTKEQFEKFQEIKMSFKEQGVDVQKTSVSNSGAIENNIGLEETMIRPGLMFYGPFSTMKSGNPTWKGTMLSKLSASIVDLFFLDKESREIGYGSTVVNGPGLFLIVSAGYGDGVWNYFRGYKFKIKDFQAEIVARVNMDMIYLKITGNDKKSLMNSFNRGDMIDFWGEDPVEFQRLCEKVGMIPYEVLCGVSQRVNRRYVE